MEVAVKIISKKEQSSSTAKNLLCETHSLKILHHPRIVALLEVIDREKTLFLVTEYVSGGDMLDHLLKHGPLTEEEARDRFRQLVSALQYCHRRDIVHRDLKLENELLHPEGNAKLADFGLCSLEPGQALSTYCGTPAYTAPEVLRLQPYDSPLVDVWSPRRAAPCRAHWVPAFPGRGLQHREAEGAQGGLLAAPAPLT